MTYRLTLMRFCFHCVHFRRGAFLGCSCVCALWGGEVHARLPPDAGFIQCWHQASCHVWNPRALAQGGQRLPCLCATADWGTGGPGWASLLTPLVVSACGQQGTSMASSTRQVAGASPWQGRWGPGASILRKRRLAVSCELAWTSPVVISTSFCYSSSAWGSKGEVSTPTLPRGMLSHHGQACGM